MTFPRALGAEMELEAAVALLHCARRPDGDVRSAELQPGTRIGNYEIVGKCLAPGGSGYVYPATELHSGGRFALKLAKPGLPLVRKIFQEERHKARLLNHPHILGAHDGGLLRRSAILGLSPARGSFDRRAPTRAIRR